MDHTQSDRSDRQTFLAPSVSPLLELPAELRNTIYRMVLISDEPIETNQAICRKPLGEMLLLQVCRQVREEAHGIFWSENIFRFTSKGWKLHQEYNILRKIGSENGGLIKRFTIDMRHTGSHWVDRPTSQQTQPTITLELMSNTRIRNEMYQLLQYGIPASSIHLMPPPSLEPSMTSLERFHARMHQQFNEGITEALEKLQHAPSPWEQLRLGGRGFRSIKISNLQSGIMLPKHK